MVINPYSDRSPISQTITYQGSLTQYKYSNVEIGNLLSFLQHVKLPSTVYLVDNLNWDTAIPPGNYDTYIIGCFGENANLKWLKTVNDRFGNKNLILITSLYYNSSHENFQNFKIFYLEHLHTIKRFYPKQEATDLKTRKFTYSILTRRFETVRLIFTVWLHKFHGSNLIYSFHKKNINDFFLNLDNVNSDFKLRYGFTMQPELIEACRQFYRLPDKIIGTAQWDVNNDAYMNTRLHWINESYYGAIGTEIFSAYLTEKTIKPIVTKTPFVLLGQIDSYKKLKTLGFLPYDDIFNINFDTGPDHDRIDKTLNLIETLTGEYIDTKLNELADIAEFNYNYFYNKFDDFCNKTNQETIESILKRCNE